MSYHSIWLNIKFLTLLAACIDPIWICNTCNSKDICCEKETSWNNSEFIHFHTSDCELHELRSVRCLGLYETTFTPSFQWEPHGDDISVHHSKIASECQMRDYDANSSMTFNTQHIIPLWSITPPVTLPQSWPLTTSNAWASMWGKSEVFRCYVSAGSFPFDLWISHESVHASLSDMLANMSWFTDNCSCPSCLIFFRVSV